MYDIYWANSLFSIADRDFNLLCSNEIRSKGFSVFLPQEQRINSLKTPSEKEIFERDTKGIYDSKIIVACIDQETIDCGVACEIGIAYSSSKYIIGLYTDIRKNRSKNKMYKNPYVIGAILSNGIIVDSIQELINEIYEHCSTIPGNITPHLDN